MPIDYSKLFSFENVTPLLKRKKLTWGDPNSPDPSITGKPPVNPLGKKAREVMLGNGGTPQNGEGENYLGISKDKLKLATGLSALSYAVNPNGPGKGMLALTSGMLNETAQAGERAREVMREEQAALEKRRQEIGDQELEYRRGLDKEGRERGYKSEDTKSQREFETGKIASQRAYDAPLRSAQIENYRRGPKPSEFDLFSSSRQGKINPATNKPYTMEENLAEYKSLGKSKKSSDTGEKDAFKNAGAELKSLGAFVDMDEGSIDFPEAQESSINKALKKYGISFYPDKNQITKGQKRYYLGSYNQGQRTNSGAGATFNLEDYLPK